MKNSETDSEFFKSIKSTLDNYEEHYILGAWESFVKQRRKRRMLIFWWFSSGIAAILVIGWIGFRIIGPDHFTASHGGEVLTLTNNEKPKTIEKETLPQKILIAADSSEYNKSERTNNTGNKLIKNIQPATHQRVTGDNGSINIMEKDNTLQAFQPVIQPDTSAKDPAFEKLISSHKSDTLNTAGSSPDYPAHSSAGNPDLNRQDSARYRPAFKQPDSEIKQSLETASINSKRKIRFGVNFSPGVNSTSSASSFNYSGGVNAEIFLVSGLRLSTGLQVEHQSVVSNGPVYDPVTPRGQTKAYLVDLDLPLNITWKFSANKATSYYVSGGISSLVYLSEKYVNTNYSQELVEVVVVVGGVEDVTYEIQNVKKTEMKTEEPFNTFNFAGRVNILFGMQQRLSSNIFLHVEPYLKIPVSGLATQNLKFTTSGITCKISF